MLYKTTFNSSLGELIPVSDSKNLVGLYFKGQKNYFLNIKEKPIEKDDLKIFDDVKLWISKYFEGENPDVSKIPILLNGSSFQKNVWEILLKIPYGKVTTYGKIAQKIGQIEGKNKISAQAIGNAVSKNPISVIIPCHRVIAQNGSLTGYAGGIEKKIKLLKLENPDLEILKAKEKLTNAEFFNLPF